MMTHLRLPALAACLVMLCALRPAISPANAQTAEPPDVIRNAVAQFIVPAHQKFNDDAAQLENTIAVLCATPSTGQLQQARDDFDAIILAWSSISIIRIGPVLEDNRLERLLFWPDRRGIGLRQVQALLVTKDPTALDPEGLAKKSVATQGLAALEFVLFGTGAETLTQEAESFRCGYGRAISANISRISQDLLT
ncbi:MAG: imelysin family protein [Rhizobiaceae bacterium]|nr:imelysin family protein [Rhizobiaceae bacterium]